MNNTLQFPILGASVLMVFNIDSIPVNLNVSMDVLIEIYKGTISRWNDEKIQQLNPLLSNSSFPSDEIIPLHYLRDNGATHIFTETLCAYSEWWCKHVGVGEKVPFPHAKVGGFMFSLHSLTIDHSIGFMVPGIR